MALGSRVRVGVDVAGGNAGDADMLAAATLPWAEMLDDPEVDADCGDADGEPLCEGLNETLPGAACDKLALVDTDALALAKSVPAMLTSLLGEDDPETDRVDAENELLLDELDESVPAVVALALKEGDGLPEADIWPLGD